jgi:hypothetical protein
VVGRALPAGDLVERRAPGVPVHEDDRLGGGVDGVDEVRALPVLGVDVGARRPGFVGDEPRGDTGVALSTLTRSANSASDIEKERASSL